MFVICKAMDKCKNYGASTCKSCTRNEMCSDRFEYKEQSIIEEFTCQDCEYYDSYNGLCKKTKEEKHFLDSVCKDFKFVPLR